MKINEQIKMTQTTNKYIFSFRMKAKNIFLNNLYKKKISTFEQNKPRQIERDSKIIKTKNKNE